MTVGELALRARISKAMLSKIENSLTSSSLTTLARLAAALDVPVTALFAGADGAVPVGRRLRRHARRTRVTPASARAGGPGMLRTVPGSESSGDAYAAVIRQAAHDAVRALLSAPPDSLEGSAGLREVTSWLLRRYGPGAVADLADELAVDLAEAFDALAAVEGRDPLEVLDAWFHDEPEPDVPAPVAEPEAGRREDPPPA
jgi:erythromycin esterase-like protein